jgi:hypothetical protein
LNEQENDRLNATNQMVVAGKRKSGTTT